MFAARPIALALLFLAPEFSPARAQVTDHGAAALTGIAPVEISGAHNVHRLGTNVYSGSTPESAEAFAALAGLGVKTMISVDGVRPDVEAARRHGLRYVHLPHGYNGINTNLQLLLAQAGHSLPGPIYVHCHHGKHRGPTAAAIVCMANEGWTRAQAENWLTRAGTSTNYAGLYETVRQFKAPTLQQLTNAPAKFPEIAKVSGLVELMVDVDERWEHLKAVRAAGYLSPPDHPDIRPVNEAVILWEGYREAQRLPEASRRGERFVSRLRNAEAETREIEGLLRQFAASPSEKLRPRLDAAFAAAGRSCTACHKEFRD